LPSCLLIRRALVTATKGVFKLPIVVESDDDSEAMVETELEEEVVAEA
jgi:uncharacterized protein (UPF0216 family)